MGKEKEFAEFEETSRKVRKTILDLIYNAKCPHIGSALSTVEGLVALYFKYLKNTPENPQNENRDRFILSKGHACPALYAVLFKRGYISNKYLDGFAKNGGTLELHPKRDLSRGIELSTGSLGHGLSIGAGMALCCKNDGKAYRAYVMLSDGDMNEGSTWEAVMFASQHKLANLVAIVDYNRIQAMGPTENIIDLDPLIDKWRAFGWNAVEVDGHDFEPIFGALESLSSEKPNVIIMRTVKGKGISFMENTTMWHYRSPDDEEYKLALKELSK